MPSIALSRSLFARAVAGVAYVAEKPNSAIPVLELISISFQPPTAAKMPAYLTLTATNNWQLARVGIPVTAFDPVSLLIPATTLKAYMKSFGRKASANMLITWDDHGAAALTCDDQTLDVALTDARYPDADRLIPPPDDGAHVASVYAGDLAAAAASACAILPGKYTHPARLEISDDLMSLTTRYDGLRTHVTCRADTTTIPGKKGHTGIDPFKLALACQTFDGLAAQTVIRWDKPEASAITMRATLVGNCPALALIMPMTIKQEI